MAMKRWLSPPRLSLPILLTFRQQVRRRSLHLLSAFPQRVRWQSQQQS
ncbi:unnamed protein product, partial [Rotaria sp. Silwood1]